MTFSDSSTPDGQGPAAFPFQEPFAFILTHMRGGAVLVCRSAGEGFPSVANEPPEPSTRFLRAARGESSDRSQTATALFHGLFPLQERFARRWDSGAPFLAEAGEGFAVVLGTRTTAEYLAEMYTCALSHAGISEADVGRVVVGVGPGSFTGLRLGCAFAGGLLLGGGKEGWRVPCPPPLAVAEAVRAAGLEENWSIAVADRLPDTEFHGHVTLADVMVSLLGFSGSGSAPVDTFVPAYGREPGPVLKLKSGLLP